MISELKKQTFQNLQMEVQIFILKASRMIACSRVEHDLRGTRNHYGYWCQPSHGSRLIHVKEAIA